MALSLPDTSPLSEPPAKLSPSAVSVSATSASIACIRWISHDYVTNLMFCRAAVSRAGILKLRVTAATATPGL
jgi:hypothetical protein